LRVNQNAAPNIEMGKAVSYSRTDDRAGTSGADGFLASIREGALSSVRKRSMRARDGKTSKQERELKRGRGGREKEESESKSAVLLHQKIWRFK